VYAIHCLFRHCCLGNRMDTRPVKSCVDLLVVVIWLELCTSWMLEFRLTSSRPPLSLNVAAKSRMIWHSAAGLTGLSWKPATRTSVAVVVYCKRVVVLSSRLANMLTGPCRLSRGEPVLVLMAKWPQWWLLNIACARAGIIALATLCIARSLPSCGVCPSVCHTPVLCLNG